MSFADFFKSIFGGTKCQFQPDELDINVTDDAIIINGNKLLLPCMLDGIAKLFGKPRATEPRTNVIYTWDELGIICYARTGSKMVHCLSIRTQPWVEYFDFDPHSPYVGKIRINGDEDWEKVMSHGNNTGSARRIENDNYVMNARYRDRNGGSDDDGCVGAYEGVEISMKGI